MYIFDRRGAVAQACDRKRDGCGFDSYSENGNSLLWCQGETRGLVPPLNVSKIRRTVGIQLIKQANVRATDNRTTCLPYYIVKE